MREPLRRRPTSLVGLLAAGLAATLAAAPPALRVKASPAVAPCAAAAALAYERASGQGVAVQAAEIGMPGSAAGADVVVAADAELQRIEESGASDPDLELAIARIPWVLAVAPGTDPDVRAVARQDAVVRTLDGVAAREAWRSLALQGFAPARVERQRGGPVRLGPGEAAIVPLSLAPPGPASSLDVPPLVARAVGIRAGGRRDAARSFLAFLAGEAGNAAFRACGREEKP